MKGLVTILSILENYDQSMITAVSFQAFQKTYFHMKWILTVVSSVWHQTYLLRSHAGSFSNERGDLVCLQVTASDRPETDAVEGP